MLLIILKLVNLILKRLNINIFLLVHIMNLNWLKLKIYRFIQILNKKVK